MVGLCAAGRSDNQNILDQFSGWHKAADSCVIDLAESGRAWAIPWPCIHEFLAITPHPRIYQPPTPVHIALNQVECWLYAANSGQ
jgi:hypothetical protein